MQSISIPNKTIAQTHCTALTAVILNAELNKETVKEFMTMWPSTSIVDVNVDYFSFQKHRMSVDQLESELSFLQSQIEEFNFDLCVSHGDLQRRNIIHDKVAGKTNQDIMWDIYWSYQPGLNR